MTEYNTTPSGQPLGISHRPSPCRELFTRFKAQDKPAFIGYLPFGFPTMEQSLEAFATMVENGADIVEIGLPYSDPVMDGPVIQAASQIALNNGERIADVFKAVETVANAGGVPLIMSYWNLIYHYGVERFAADFANAGGAGLITPDLIPDEAGEWIEASDRHGLDRIFLVSPDSTDERLRVVCENARGFVYAASRMGVTGERSSLGTSPEDLVARTRKAGAENVCVGIGVSTAASGSMQTGSSLDPPWSTPCSPRMAMRASSPQVWLRWRPRPQNSPRASTTHACSGTLLVGGRDNESGCQPIPVLCRYRFSTLYSSV